MAKQAKSTTSEKSKKGPHGGGTPYQQMKVAKGFITVERRPGHNQKKNLNKQ